MNHSPSENLVKDQGPADRCDERVHAPAPSQLAPQNVGKTLGQNCFATDHSPPKQLRWVGRILALLVVACLLLAAWVWSEILRGLP